MQSIYREGGDESKRRDYLPNDKQFLITRNGKYHIHPQRHVCQLSNAIPVPCLRRAKQMEYTEDDKETEIKGGVDGDNEDDEDGWMYTHSDRGMLNSVQ